MCGASPCDYASMVHGPCGIVPPATNAPSQAALPDIGGGGERSPHCRRFLHRHRQACHHMRVLQLVLCALVALRPRPSQVCSHSRRLCEVGRAWPRRHTTNFRRGLCPPQEIQICAPRRIVYFTEARPQPPAAAEAYRLRGRVHRASCQGSRLPLCGWLVVHGRPHVLVHVCVGALMVRRRFCPVHDGFYSRQIG